MFNGIKNVVSDLRYCGVKRTVTNAIDYAKYNPGKTAACIIVDVAAKAIPGGTIVKEAGKFVAKSVVKDQIRK